MHDLTILYQLAVIFGIAVVVVVLLGRIGLPSIAGLIVAGVLVGPNGLRLVEDVSVVEALAEVGVVLLLFTIGLEFSLERLRRIWRLVTIGGGIQVALTVGAVCAAAVAWGYSWQQGLFFGFLAALSSTAIVLRALTERDETDAPHGRMIVGILIFQDLCVVPMMLIVPMLAAGAAASPAAVFTTLGKAALMVLAVAGGAWLVVPRLLAIVAAERKRDLFVLTVLLICLGTAWLTSLSGLSLALGAFLAGIVLAGSGYGHQAMSDVLPFRDSFASLFFVSVGMLLDLRILGEEPLAVAGLFLAILVGKFLLATLAALVMRFPVRVAVLTGVGLAQVGEFSFVLAQTGASAGLMSAVESRLFLAATVLSMLVTPVLVRLGPHFTAGMHWMNPLERVFGTRGADEGGPDVQGMRDHVVIAGFGLGGQTLAKSLKSSGIPYAILELNPATVDRFRAEDEPIFYGDVSSQEVLNHMNCAQARELVLMISDLATARRAIAAVRQCAPEQHITIRTRYFEDVGELKRIGADDVVVEEFENAVELMARVLRRFDTPRNVIAARIAEARHSRADLVRPLQIPRRRLAHLHELLEEVKVESYLLDAEHWAVERTCREIDLRHATGASVVALKRSGKIVPSPSPDERLLAGDVVYLIGDQQAVTLAMETLERGIATDPEADAHGEAPAEIKPAEK